MTLITQRRREAESAERRLRIMKENEITRDILDAAMIAMNLPLGLLINFGMEKLVDGYVRVVNGFDDTSAILS
ncbi:MAG: hypothetical protein IJ658_04915 [Kiritimatiellae bacterium]|nr:hypothetical protein [Kiritimatiellia bacterium]